jgi:hypothetical protein
MDGLRRNNEERIDVQECTGVGEENFFIYTQAYAHSMSLSLHAYTHGV